MHEEAGDELQQERRASAARAHGNEHAPSDEGGDSETVQTAAAVEVLVATDVCLRALDGRSLPLGLLLLVNYDFPSRKVWILPHPSELLRYISCSLKTSWSNEFPS